MYIFQENNADFQESNQPSKVSPTLYVVLGLVCIYMIYDMYMIYNIRNTNMYI